MNRKRRLLCITLIMIVIAAAAFNKWNDEVVPNNSTRSFIKKLGDVNNSIDILQIRSLDVDNVKKILHFDGESRIIMLKKIEKEYEEDKERNIVVKTRIQGKSARTFKIDNRILKSDSLRISAGFSPNGQYLDYKQNKERRIYNIGKEKSVRYRSAGVNGGWSGDSSSLIKIYNKITGNGRERGFAVFDTRGEVLRKKTVNPKSYSLDLDQRIYSEDGMRVAFMGSREIQGARYVGVYQYDFESDGYTKLFQKRVDGEDDGFRVHDFQIIDDTRMIISAEESGEMSLYMVDISSGDTAHFFTQGKRISFKVSPDGAKVTFSIEKISKRSEEKRNIYIGRIEENDVSDITFLRKDSFADDFFWSNDSRDVIFVEEGNEKITLVKIK